MNNKLVASIISVSILVIITAVVLIPVVNNAEENIGPEITYDNPAAGYRLDYTKTATVTMASTGTDGAQTLICNGVNIERGASFNTALILTDSFAVEVPTEASGFSILIRSPSGNMFRSASTAETVTITCANGTATINIAGVETVYEYTWMLSVKTNGAYANIPGHLSNVYYSDPNELMCYAYNASYGYVTYHKGVATSSVYGEGSATYTASSVDGTTDINRVNSTGIVITFNDGATTANIGASVGLYKVEGHEVSSYSGLLHTIPVLVLVSILASIVVFAKFRD